MPTLKELCGKLSPEKQENYDKCLVYLQCIRDGLNLKESSSNYRMEKENIKINVFGGFLRYLFSEDEQLNDLDIYIYKDLDRNPSFSANEFGKCLACIRHHLKKLDFVSSVSSAFYSHMTDTMKYGRATININKKNGETFKIDMSTKINCSPEVVFNYSCDYTVNSLYVPYNEDGTFGDVKNRVSSTGVVYSIGDILKHIENKELINIIDIKKLAKYIYYLNGYFNGGNPKENKFIKQKIEGLEAREKKMLSKGYKGKNLPLDTYYEKIENIIKEFKDEPWHLIMKS